MAGRKKEDKKIETGGELNDYPNEKYKKFFDKFSEIETLEVSQWKPVHLLAYFCKKYQIAYDVKYQFKFNSPNPTNCFEIFQIKKLAMQLSSNPGVLRDYIDWVYKVKVEQGKRRLTSISFMTHDGLVNDYKFNVLLANKQDLHIDRSTALPAEIKKIVFEASSQINTYGDLSFIWHAHKSAELGPQYVSVFSKLSEINFDFSVLDRIV